MKNMDYSGRKKILLCDIADKEYAQWLRDELNREYNIVCTINHTPGKGFYLIYRYGGKGKQKIKRKKSITELLTGGKVYTYAQGSNTPKTTYKDGNGNTKNENPVILDSNGEADI